MFVQQKVEEWERGVSEQLVQSVAKKDAKMTGEWIKLKLDSGFFALQASPNYLMNKDFIAETIPAFYMRLEQFPCFV